MDITDESIPPAIIHQWLYSKIVNCKSIINRTHLNLSDNREHLEGISRCFMIQLSESEGPNRAKIFEITDLIAMFQASRQNSSGSMIKAWTYVLVSMCTLFLCKAEAAALLIGDIEVPVDKVSGQPLIVDGLPRYLFVHIRQSKTDQDGQGIWIFYTCCSNNNDTVFLI